MWNGYKWLSCLVCKCFRKLKETKKQWKHIRDRIALMGQIYPVNCLFLRLSEITHFSRLKFVPRTTFIILLLLSLKVCILEFTSLEYKRMETLKHVKGKESLESVLSGECCLSHLKVIKWKPFSKEASPAHLWLAEFSSNACNKRVI